MAFIPKAMLTNVRLYSGNMPIDMSAGLEPAFVDTAAQEAFFARYATHEYPKNSFQRKGNEVKLELTPAEADKVQYLSFRNVGFDDRTFYAQVTDWRYINNKVCALTFNIDPIQTYHFDFKVRTARITQEHLTFNEETAAKQNPWRNDILGLLGDGGCVTSGASYAEVQQTGDAIVLPSTKGTGTDDLYTVIQLAAFRTEAFDDATLASNLFNRFEYVIYPDGTATTLAGTTTNPRHVPIPDVFQPVPRASYLLIAPVIWWDRVNLALEWLTAQNMTESILGWPAMHSRSILGLLYGPPTLDRTTGWITGVNATEVLLPRDITFDGYVPHNPKLYRAPFMYLEVSNPEGEVKDYKYEFFQEEATGTNRITFGYGFNMDARPYALLYPYNYRQSGTNIGERIETTQFPEVPYVTDSFLAASAVQLQQNLRARVGNSDSDPTLRMERLQIQGAKERREGVLGGLGDAAKGVGNVIVGGAQLVAGVSAGVVPLEAVGKTLGGAYSAVKGVTHAVEASNSASISDRERAAQQRINDQATNWRAGSALTTMAPFMDTEAGYVNNPYQPASSPVPAFYNNRPLQAVPGGSYSSVVMAPGLFTATRKRIKRAYAEQWDAYFDRYGMPYETGIDRIPCIMQYIGLGNIGDGPAWKTITDGLRWTYQISFVKTSVIEITGVDLIEAARITEMFNSGIRWIKDGTVEVGD